MISWKRRRFMLASCPPLNDVDGQPAQSTHRLDVDIDVGAVDLVEQRAVVGRVAREQQLRLGVPQPDASPRVSWEVEDLERSIAEVDHITFVKQRGGAGSMPWRTVEYESFMGHCGEQTAADVVAPPSEQGEVGFGRLGHVEFEIAGDRRDDRGFGDVNTPLLELMEATNMVGVRMSGDSEDVLAEEVSDRTRRLVTPSPVSTSRSMSRPRTCQMLHRSSG